MPGTLRRAILARSAGKITLPSPSPLVAVYLSTTQIHLSWVGMVVDSFSLERATESDFSDATEVYSGTDNSYSDSDLTMGETYYYRLVASKTGFLPSEPITATAQTLSFMPEFNYDGRGIDLGVENDYADTSLTGVGQSTTIDVLKSTINTSGPTATPVSTLAGVINGNATGATGGNVDFAVPVIRASGANYDLSSPVTIGTNEPFTIMARMCFLDTPVNHRLTVDLTDVNKRIQFNSLSVISVVPTGTTGRNITLSTTMVLRKVYDVVIQRMTNNTIRASIDGGANWNAASVADGAEFQIGRLFGSLSVHIERICLVKQELTESQISEYFTQGEVPVYTPAATVESSERITIKGATYNDYTGPYISDADLGNNATTSTNRGMRMLSVGDKICFLAQKEWTTFRSDNFYAFDTTTNKLSSPIEIPSIGVGVANDHDTNSFIDYDRKFLFMGQNLHYTRVPNSTIIRTSAPNFDLRKISKIIPIGDIPNTLFSMSQYHGITVMNDGSIQVSMQGWDGEAGGYINHFSISNKREFSKLLVANTLNNTEWLYPLVPYNNVIGDWHYLFIRHFPQGSGKYNYLYLIKTPSGSECGKVFYNMAETFSQDCRGFNFITTANLQANCLVFDNSADLGGCVCHSVHVDADGVIHGVAGRGDGGYRGFKILTDGTIEQENINTGSTNVIQNDEGIPVAHYGNFLRPLGGDAYEWYALYDTGDGLWQPTKFSTTDFWQTVTEDRNFITGLDSGIKHTRIMGPQNICYNQKMAIMATTVVGSSYGGKILFKNL